MIGQLHSNDSSTSQTVQRQCRKIVNEDNSRPRMAAGLLATAQVRVLKRNSKSEFESSRHVCPSSLQHMKASPEEGWLEMKAVVTGLNSHGQKQPSVLEDEYRRCHSMMPRFVTPASIRDDREQFSTDSHDCVLTGCHNLCQGGRPTTRVLAKRHSLKLLAGLCLVYEGHHLT